MSPQDALLIVNAAATWFMCGIIWLVQIVHYPLFREYDRGSFTEAMETHQRRTAWVVSSPILIELITSVLLLVWPPRGVPLWMRVTGVVLVAVCGLSTWIRQVPLHERLATGGFNEHLHQRLVQSNWLRTVVWSLHGALCAVMLCRSS